MLKRCRALASLIFLITFVGMGGSSIGHAQENDRTVIDAIVNIHLNKVRAWDDGYNSATQGTGFVIDSEKGIILTNRHIVNVGPVVAYAEFSNKKRVELVPIYRDPVHDFGLFQYDPEKINGLNIAPIALSTSANIGEPITLYGNDGGEDLSIIEGVLSRVDRPAPDYRNTNTDFNTFYFQAALGSSGGSSGSPILNAQNQAIAINAGARRDTETAFFLPMEMALPIIEKVLNGQDVSRGTLQTVFNFVPFNRFSSLGLTQKALEIIDAQGTGANGNLMVSYVIPEGPGDGVLETGDLLLTMQNQMVNDFFTFETILNSHVGDEIALSVIRNNALVELSLPVNDLFALTPDQYVEYGSSIAIPVGLAMARLFNVPAKGVTLVDAGPSFGSRGIKRFALIEELNNTPVKNIEDFIEGLSKVAAGDKFSVRYRYPYDVNYQQYKQLTDYSNWFDNKHCKSVIGERHWSCTPLKKVTDKSEKAVFSPVTNVSSPIVDIEVFRPVLVNNLNDVIRYGLGAIVDRDAGLILTDKSVIDSSLGVINITFNNGVDTFGEVMAIHPLFNLALIKTDMSGIQFGENVLPELASDPISKNQKFRYLGKSAFLDFEVEVSSGWPILQRNSTFHDSYTFSSVPSFFGIYVSDKNHLAAVNTTYQTKKAVRNDIIPSSLVEDFLLAAKEQKTGMYKIESTLEYTRLADALALGLDGKEYGEQARFISVRNVEALGSGGLLPGDILLKLNNKAVESLNHLHHLVSSKNFTLDVLRNGEVVTISSEAKLKPFEKFEDVLFWGGAVIHQNHENVFFPEGPAESCLRIGIFYYGSPMHSSETAGQRCLYQVDGTRVESIPQLVNLLENKAPGEYSRVKVIELNNNFRVAEMRLQEDPYYWPIKHWQRSDSGWQRIRH